MRAVNTPQVPAGKPPNGGMPRWLFLVLGLSAWFVGMPLVHGVLPWAVSLLGPRFGWKEGRPGTWNLLGLIPVVLGTACLIWILGFGLARVSELPRRMKLASPYLLTRGPYAFSRNPMYLADLVLWLGWVLFYGSIAVLLTLLALGLVGTSLVVPHEERVLESRFGENYRQYKRTVPRWLGKTRR